MKGSYRIAIFTKEGSSLIFYQTKQLKEKKLFISSHLISQQRLPKLTLRLRQQRLEFAISPKCRGIAAKQSKNTAYEN